MAEDPTGAADPAASVGATGPGANDVSADALTPATQGMSPGVDIGATGTEAVLPAPAVDPVAITGQPDGLIGAGVSGVGELVDIGGPIVALLLVLSVVALTIALVKFWQFARFGVGRWRLDAVIRQWCSRQDDGAADRAALLPGPVAAMVARAMTGLQSGEAEVHVREEIELSADETVSALRSYLRALEAIAQAAPLLGLLGTVLGMIDAFKVLEASGGDVDPAGLAGGIWVALMTTAVGLAVAIPTALALHWFDGRVDRERRRIERLATLVLTHPPLRQTSVARPPASIQPVAPVVTAHADLSHAY